MFHVSFWGCVWFENMEAQNRRTNARNVVRWEAWRSLGFWRCRNDRYCLWIQNLICCVGYAHVWPHVQYMFGRMLTMICDMFGSMKPNMQNWMTLLFVHLHGVPSARARYGSRNNIFVTTTIVTCESLIYPTPQGQRRIDFDYPSKLMILTRGVVLWCFNVGC